MVEDGKRKQPRVTIGRYPAMGVVEARTKAREVLANPKAAIEPDTAPAPAVATVEFVMVEWLRRDQATKRSCAETEQILRRELAAWLVRPITEIKRYDVQKLIDATADRAPVMARRLRAHLHRMWQWALRREYVDVNIIAVVDAPARPTPATACSTPTS